MFGSEVDTPRVLGSQKTKQIVVFYFGSVQMVLEDHILNTLFLIFLFITGSYLLLAMIIIKDKRYL